MPRVERDPRLLVLGAGREQLGLLRAARQRDLLVIAVDRDPAAPGFRYADRRALISFEDEPAIHRLAEAERIDGVISPANDWSVGIAARVARRLGLPHPLDGPTAALAASWLRQREWFAATGVPQDPWLGEGAEATVQAFSLSGEFHALSGSRDAADLAARAAGVRGIGGAPPRGGVGFAPPGRRVMELAPGVGPPADVEAVRKTTG